MPAVSCRKSRHGFDSFVEKGLGSDLDSGQDGGVMRGWRILPGRGSGQGPGASGKEMAALHGASFLRIDCQVSHATVSR